MRVVRTLVRQGVFGDLACSRIELPDVALEVCRKPDVACAISHQAIRAGVGCLQLELSHLAGYRIQAPQRIRFLSGVPERAIRGPAPDHGGWSWACGISHSLPAKRHCRP